MPSTINGVGTKYYGKRNSFHYEDYCSQCNRYVELSSYDTREWFVVLFIPIIPLQQKRITDFCPSCTWHRAMSSKKYLKGKDEDYTEAMEKYNANPNNPEAVAELLEIFGAYQDMESFESLKNEATQNFAGDSTIQAAIGFVYYNYGNMEQARDYFEKSLVLKDDEHVHEILGFVYLRFSKVDKAAEHFQYIIDQGIQDKIGTLFALVDGYQGQGRHQDALDMMDVAIEIDPSVKKQKAYKKTRKLSDKHLESGKPVRSKQAVMSKTQRGVKTPVNSKKTWAIAGSVVAAAILIFVITAFYHGMNPNVYLVNGLKRSYGVTLNGKTYTLPEYGYMKIPVSEGDISLMAESLGVDQRQLKLRSSFLSRPFLKRVYVINPDMVAPVLWTKIYYAENPDRAPDSQWKLHIGKSFYVFDEIDLPFKEFPDEISLSSSSTVEFREQITMLPETEVLHENLPDVIVEHLGQEMLVMYLQKNLYYEPEKNVYLYGLLYQTEPSKFLEIIQDGLDAIPVRIDWHRCYQNVIQRSKPEIDLVKEYEVRIQEYPDDPAMHYLMGRVIEDNNDQAVFWLEKSVSGPNPCAYGYHALGYHSAAMGRFDEAVSFCEKAVQTAPDSHDFAIFYLDMLIANDKMDRALDYCREQKQKNNDFSWVRAEVELLVNQGKQEQAKELYVQYYKSHGQTPPAEIMKDLQKADELECAYIEGDFQKYLQLIGEPNELGGQLILTLNLKNSAPDTFMESPDSFAPSGLLMLYVSETRLGNTERAQFFLDEAIKTLKQIGYAERCVADCLQGGTNEDIERICHMSMTTQFKAVALTALGTRYPEHQKRLFQLAEKMNYRKTFPYHYLKMVHKESMEAGAGT